MTFSQSDTSKTPPYTATAGDVDALQEAAHRPDVQGSWTSEHMRVPPSDRMKFLSEKKKENL